VATHHSGNAWQEYVVGQNHSPHGYKEKEKVPTVVFSHTTMTKRPPTRLHFLKEVPQPPNVTAVENKPLITFWVVHLSKPQYMSSQ
jgi:hypothetical protein